jgi:hypothetical protein
MKKHTKRRAPADELRAHSLPIKFSASEHIALMDAAYKCGVKVSTFIAHMALREAEQINKIKWPKDSTIEQGCLANLFV